MSYRHIEEIDRAVAVARKAVTIGHMDEPQRLTRFLYERWYLGTNGPRIPAQRGSAWRSWSPLWTEAHARSGSELLRMYICCAPHTSLHALGLVTQRAREWDQPWRLTSTAVNRPVPTADATVLYLPMQSLPELRPQLRELVEELQPFLASSVPALTLRIGRGVSLAQSPADGRSFGRHRCELVATSVLANMRYHHREQLSRAMAAFAEAGVDPHRPYLEASGCWDRQWASVR